MKYLTYWFLLFNSVNSQGGFIYQILQFFSNSFRHRYKFIIRLKPQWKRMQSLLRKSGATRTLFLSHLHSSLCVGFILSDQLVPHCRACGCQERKSPISSFLLFPREDSDSHILGYVLIQRSIMLIGPKYIKKFFSPNSQTFNFNCLFRK